MSFQHREIDYTHAPIVIVAVHAKCLFQSDIDFTQGILPHPLLWFGGGHRPTIRTNALNPSAMLIARSNGIAQTHTIIFSSVILAC